MVPTRQCERCRSWVSLDLDAELSELEAAWLRRHLATCANCRAFRADAGGATSLLRRAPLVEPELHVTVPQLRRRRSTVRSAIAGLAAAAAVAAVAVSTGLGGDGQLGQRISATAAVGNTDLMTLREQRRAQLFRSMTATVRSRTRAVELY